MTAFGNSKGNTNDNWQVQLLTDNVFSINMNFALFSLIWQVRRRNLRRLHLGDRLRLIHVNTGKALHSHSGFKDFKYTSGQQEVTCFGRWDYNNQVDSNDYWEILDPLSK